MLLVGSVSASFGNYKNESYVSNAVGVAKEVGGVFKNYQDNRVLLYICLGVLVLVYFFDDSLPFLKWCLLVLLLIYVVKGVVS